MPMPGSLANGIERVRDECESHLCQLDTVDAVIWREREPDVFAVGHGYVALIPCKVTRMQALPEFGDGPVEVGIGAFAVAIKRPGAGERWTGCRMLYPDEGNVAKTMREAGAQLGRVMWRAPPDCD